jgi:hypothetical protein
MVHSFGTVQTPQPTSENEPIEAAQNAKDNASETV